MPSLGPSAAMCNGKVSKKGRIRAFHSPFFPLFAPFSKNIYYYVLHSSNVLPIFVPGEKSSGRKYSPKKGQMPMNVDNAKSQMRKGMLEYCVMLLLRRESSYASDIIARLKEADLIVVEGTLYPLLTRLKKDGLLSYEWRESTQGPPRKYYALTPEGETFLGGLDSAWNELATTVAHLKAESPVDIPPSSTD